MNRWEKCIAIVTGASSGIGAKISEELVKSGLTVVGVARRLEIMEDFAKEMAKYPDGLFYPVICDLQKEEDILNVFKVTEEKFGGVSIFVNNGGFIIPERIIGMDISKFEIIDCMILFCSILIILLVEKI